MTRRAVLAAVLGARIPSSWSTGDSRATVPKTLETGRESLELVASQMPPLNPNPGTCVPPLTVTERDALRDGTHLALARWAREHPFLSTGWVLVTPAHGWLIPEQGPLLFGGVTFWLRPAPRDLPGGRVLDVRAECGEVL